MNQTYLNSPKVTPASPPARPLHWTVIGVAAIAAGTIISVVDIIRQPLSRPPAVIKSDELIQRPGGPVNRQPATPSEPVVSPAPPPVPTPVPVVQPAPEPLALRAQPVDPVIRRASLVEGQFFAVQMPDGTVPLIRYMGSVASFDDLPKLPNLYDLYIVRLSGHSWVFMTSPTLGRAAWIDP